MRLKNYLKGRLPHFLVPWGRVGHRFLRTLNYYPQYLLMNGRAPRPREIMFEITYRCNLRCVMCPLAVTFDDPDSKIAHDWRHETELGTEEVLRMVRDAAALRVNSLGITGGEPFLRNDLITIIKAAKEVGLRCNILSNGTRIDKQLAKRIVDAKLDSLQLSLDGPREVHNEIRGKDTAYERTLQTARLVTEEKKKRGTNIPSLSFCCTISAANMTYLLPLVDIAHECGANLYFGYLFYTTQEMLSQTAALVDIGTAKGEDQDVADELKQINSNTLQKEIGRVKHRAQQLGVYCTFDPDLKEDEIKRRFYDDDYSYVNKCLYPWYALRINPYGVVYPCSMNISMGNIRQSTLRDIWNNQKYVKFRRSLRKNKLFPKCSKCCKLNNIAWRYLPSP